MGRVKKEFDSDGIFQIRFRELYTKGDMTQKELAGALGVSRPTVAGWLDGKNIPDILALKRIAEYFHVSADYLLGFSDTVSPNVSLRAAVEYTGLSEEAVERCHVGFEGINPFGIKWPEEDKKKKLRITSDLIESGPFMDILDYMIDFIETAQLFSLAEALDDQYWNYEHMKEESAFTIRRKEDRDKMIEAMGCAHQKGRLFQREQLMEEVEKMNDEELVQFLEAERFDIRDEMDLRQYQVTKGFNGYVDHILRKCRRQASRSDEE